MERTKFYNPEEIRDLYNQIVPAYQEAFAGEPWFEVSKCADNSGDGKCIGGFSNLPVGSKCENCGSYVTRPAYEEQELINKFNSIGSTQPTVWYIERNESGVTLAAITWLATASVIAKERYPEIQDMEEWLTEKLGSITIGWLDEVFANKSIKPSGNLKNFYAMCIGFSRLLDINTIAYRTINEHMLATTKRDFGKKALIYKRNVMVSDRRDFVIINVGEEK